ncbi:hypothetical protein AB870_12540 [Pandoraea faecigallinarum]|uniref:DUF2946 domain-containing protein n=1 Tax=Pandoraea faecigallinarum TaxID=656179 RepID=A0A0H3WSZ9_9BURK|nr:hypothetical protein [Pandoraea faecigallinarum]AKM30755.1 hypothetical protein AB870_12540 [Pandoraea faecigallinarum]
MRTSLGRGRSAWIVWLIAAWLCVQMWGLQHEIVHARELSGAWHIGAPHGTHRGAKAANVPDDVVKDAADDPGNAAAKPVRALQAGFGTQHHHCHLFEGATLAAGMAVAMLQWAGDADKADAPLRVDGRSHASAVLLPFDSRAPPVAV